MTHRLVAILCLSALLLTGCSSGLESTPETQPDARELQFETVDSGLSSEPGASTEQLTGRVVERGNESTRLRVSTTEHATITGLTLEEGELWVTLESTGTAGTAHEPLQQSLVEVEGQLPEDVPIRFRDTEGEELHTEVTREQALENARTEVGPGLRPSQSSFALRAEPGGAVDPVWVFFFDEGEFLNAQCDAIISGEVAVSARTGEVYEPKLARNTPYPPSLRVPNVGHLFAVTAEGSLVTRKEENGPFYMVDSDGETEELGLTAGEWTLIDDLEQPRPDEWFITLPEPDGGGEWVWVWDQFCPAVGDHKSLFFVTEVTGPHYGDFWTRYHLWEFDLQEQDALHLVTLPEGPFYVFPSCRAVAVNYLDGVLIVPLQGR